MKMSLWTLPRVLHTARSQLSAVKYSRKAVPVIAEARRCREVIPELVGLDADGRPKTVDYSRFVSVLAKAVQELSAETDGLREQLATEAAKAAAAAATAAEAAAKAEAAMATAEAAMARLRALEERLGGA